MEKQQELCFNEFTEEDIIKAWHEEDGMCMLCRNDPISFSGDFHIRDKCIMYANVYMCEKCSKTRFVSKFFGNLDPLISIRCPLCGKPGVEGPQMFRGRRIIRTACCSDEDCPLSVSKGVPLSMWDGTDKYTKPIYIKELDEQKAYEHVQANNLKKTLLIGELNRKWPI